jgi:TP901 family phage tail tape measure protein
MAKGNDLAVAYVQLLPSFDKFFAKAASDLSAKASEFKKYGAQAGASWAQGFAANAKATTSSTATPSGGGGIGASGAAVAGAGAVLGAEVGAELGAVEAAAGAAGLRVGTNFAQGLTKSGALLSGAGTALTAGVTVPLVAVGALATNSAIQFESAFAGVRKTVNASEEEFAQLEQGIRDLGKEIPATREEIAKVTELGGQFGVPNENLLEFTRTVVDLGVATNLSSEEGALLLAQFANITGLPTDQFDNLGSTIVDLGNNLSTTEDRIAQFALRLGGQGSIIGLTQDQILGFSAALASVGIMPEAGGTAFSRVFQRISDAVETGNEDLQAFADTTGLTVEQFEALYDTDPSALINQFVKGLGEVASSGGTTPLLDELELVDVRIRDSLQRLAGSEDILGKALGISSSAWQENIALTTEAERRYATTESQLQIFQNRIGDVGVTLGEVLLPAVNGLLGALQPVLDGAQNFAEFFGELPEPVQKTALAIGVVAAASGPLAALLGRIATGLGSVALNSGAATTGMTSYAAATSQAATAQTALAAAQARNAATMAGSAAAPAAAPAAAGGAAAAASGLGRGLLAALLAINLTADATELFTGRAEDATAAANALNDALSEGTVTATGFAEAAAADNFNRSPIGGLIDNTNDLVRGQGSIGGVDVEYREIDRAIRDVAKNGTDALTALKSELIDQQSTVQRNTEEWETLSYAIRQVNAEAGIERDPGTLGEGVGSSIAGKNAQDRAALEGTVGILKPLGIGVRLIESAVPASESFAKSLAKVQAEGKLAAVGITAAATAADSYRAAIENAGTDDNVLSSALTAGAGFRGLLEGGGFQDSESERQGRARKIAQEQDRLATEMRDSATSTEAFDNAIKRLNPELAVLEANTQAAAAAGNAYRKSIEDSSYIDDVIGSTVSLGDAYKTARKSIRGLPADLDLAAVSLGKLKPRQQRAVEGVLALGEATADYLGTLIESGRSNAEVVSEADRLRESYVAQFRQLGLNEQQIRKYLEAMGLTPEQVNTAIKVSGIEESRAKLEAYASLLEGKIPGSVASSVIASIEAGDIEGAAAQLARFAATNPIDIPLTVTVDQPAITTAQDALDELERQTLDLPQAYNAVTAALGGYTEDQERGLQALITQGDAAQDVIAELIAKGVQTGDLGFTEANDAADRFRSKFTDILAQYGIVGAEAEAYLDDLLQLDEVDVENSIKLAGMDAALTEITLYQDLLKAIGVGLPAEVGKLIAENLRDKNYEGVAAILEQFTSGELGLTPEPVTLGVEVDTLPAQGEIEFFRLDENGKPVTITADAATKLAEEGVQVFRVDEEGTILEVPVDANTDAARSAAAALFFDIGRLAPIMKVGIQFAVDAGAAAGTAVKAGADRFAQSAVGGRGNYGYGFNPYDIDNNPDTPFATGGYVSGPGTGTSDSIQARLSNGEYVMTAGAVRSLGVDFLDKLNKGYVPGFAMGGLVGDTPAPASTLGGVNVDYTVVEATSRPTAEDLVRVTNSALFLGASG